MAFASGFQWFRVGGPVTELRSETDAFSISTTCPTSELLLSLVDVRFGDFTLCSRLSVLPLRLRGGVRGDCLCGLSVGRSTAGTYIGDFGGRSWIVAKE